MKTLDQFPPTCEACLYWKQEEHEAVGVCYAMPPTVQPTDDGSIESARPLTAAADPACAFFRPRH